MTDKSRPRADNGDDLPTRDEARPARRPRLTPGNLETAIDKQIREAMERGDFDNLRGQGKPLNLSRDPNVPADWELAYDLLKNAGYAPDWIETLKDIRAEQTRARAPLERVRAQSFARSADRQQAQALAIKQFRERAAELNKLIDTFNLKAPTPQVHLRRIRIEEEIARFLRDTEA